MGCVWTITEEQALARLAGKTKISRISKILGRSEQSVRAKATKLKLSLEHGRTRWSSGRITQLCTLRESGDDWETIAKKLGVSSASCQKAYSREVCAQRQRAGDQFDVAVRALEDVLAGQDLADDVRAAILEGFSARRGVFVQQTRVESADDKGDKV